MKEFGSWFDLLTYLEEHNDIVYYQPPMDHWPNIVVITKKFKNGKLRVAFGPYSFTADKTHLHRFMWKE